MSHQITTAICSIVLITMGGCDTISSSKKNYYDEPFKNSAKPHTTAFKYLKNFSEQKFAPGQAGSVQTIRYYSGGKYVGMTQFAARSWFSTQTEDNIKNRLRRTVKRKFPNDTSSANALATYRNLQDFGAYLEKDGCAFMSFYKRLKGPGLFDNDYGDPDFVGMFVVCDGLTVSPSEFIRRIDLANEEDRARYAALLVSTPTPAKAAAVGRNGQPHGSWETRSIAANWTGFSELIAGEISFRRTGQQGRIKLTLPKAIGLCNGTYRMTARRRGTWSVACTNGMMASGTLEAYGSGKGSSGKGEDNQGRPVKFTVGGR